MPNDLHQQLLRLASQHPEMRPYLVDAIRVAGQHREAWSRIPDGAFDFGYEGDGAELLGVQLADEVKEAILEMKVHARKSWKSAAARLMDNKKVDAQPSLSRRMVALALVDTYAELSKKAEQYFKNVP